MRTNYNSEIKLLETNLLSSINYEICKMNLYNKLIQKRIKEIESLRQKRKFLRSLTDYFLENNEIIFQYSD